MLIFAVSGWKGSGKDMVAEYLVKEHGFKRVSFADKLKNNVASQFDVPRTHLDDNRYKEAPILSMPVDPKDEFSVMVAKYLFKNFRSKTGDTPAQFIETSEGWKGAFKDPGLEDLRLNKLYWTPRALAILEGSTKRTANGNYWVERAVSDLDPSYNYVISDARFKNELSQLQKVQPGAIVEVRINRFNEVNSTDASEHDLDNHGFDHYINNSQEQEVTKEGVYGQIDAILDFETKKRLAHEGQPDHQVVS